MHLLTSMATDNPDFVESNGADKLIVHRNLTGRTNLLKGVTLPFGGHVTVEYKQTKPSYNMPGRAGDGICGDHGRLCRERSHQDAQRV